MARHRNPEQTRERLTDAAFSEIYASGYTAASLDRILDAAGVTKGALYHHFGSKKALAQAVIAEKVRAMVVDSWLIPLASSADAIDGVQACLNESLERVTPDRVACGCPLNNLAQELSATDDDFREQINEIYEHWRASVADALERGRKAGQVRDDVDSADLATFVVASVAGIAGFTKSTRDVNVARTSMRVLCSYLDTLRVSSPD